MENDAIIPSVAYLKYNHNYIISNLLNKTITVSAITYFKHNYNCIINDLLQI